MIPRDFLKSLLDANYHCGGLKCQALFQVSQDLLFSLRMEAMRIAPLSTTKDEHKGAWTRPYGSVRQFSLYNRSGDLFDRSTDYDPNPHGKMAHSSEKYPATARLIHSLPSLLNVRLNCLGHQSGLSEHEEEIFLKKGRKTFLRLRFHLPLFTHHRAMVSLDGQQFHFEAGRIYFFHNGCVHGAFNRSDTERYHLVWDQLLSEESYRAMFEGKLTETLPIKFESYIPVGIASESDPDAPSARASRKWVSNPVAREIWDQAARWRYLLLGASLGT